MPRGATMKLWAPTSAPAGHALLAPHARHRWSPFLQACHVMSSIFIRSTLAPNRTQVRDSFANLVTMHRVAHARQLLGALPPTHSLKERNLAIAGDHCHQHAWGHTGQSRAAPSRPLHPVLRKLEACRGSKATASKSSSKYFPSASKSRWRACPRPPRIFLSLLKISFPISVPRVLPASLQLVHSPCHKSADMTTE